MWRRPIRQLSILSVLCNFNIFLRLFMLFCKLCRIIERSVLLLCWILESLDSLMHRTFSLLYIRIINASFLSKWLINKILMLKISRILKSNPLWYWFAFPILLWPRHVFGLYVLVIISSCLLFLILLSEVCKNVFQVPKDAFKFGVLSF